MQVQFWLTVLAFSLLLLALVPLFYVMSMHSGGTPIFVPHLWPVGSYYNTRYGAASLPLLAFAAAALVTFVPGRLKAPAAAMVVLAAASPWFGYPREDSWICWNPRIDEPSKPWPSSMRNITCRWPFVNALVGESTNTVAVSQPTVRRTRGQSGSQSKIQASVRL